jgi:ribose transport system ATP-binding protein
MNKSQYAIEVKDIVKEFSSVRVLDQVTVGIKPGEIMGLIGENGAGKSTLIKIICGIYQATSGNVFLDDQPCSLKDYVSAKNLGIAIVPQEFNLINHLAVYENIFLGNEIHKGLFLNKSLMREKASKQMVALNMYVDVNQLISKLSVAEKQMVEVSKALMLDAKILIFDEPTTTLTSKEIEILFDLMRKLQSNGVTMIFVSHKLHEIKTICDRVTILRDGKLIAIEEVDDVNEEDIARQMIGRDFSQVFPPKLERSNGDLILEVEDLNINNLLKDISFNLRRGEILGFAGLVGAGRTETMEAVMGLRKRDSGLIKINGKEVKIKKPRDAVNNKLGYISEDRQGKGIVQIFDIPKNMSLISIDKYKKGPFIDKRKEDNKSEDYIDKFNIVAASKKMELKYFSGGNQQKVYLSKWMDTNPEILILDEPTRGIDVNAKREIYEFIHSLAESGISCILISSEMEEIIGLCTRVYVMKEGQISNCITGDAINEEEIMFNATGLKGKI